MNRRPWPGRPTAAPCWSLMPGRETWRSSRWEALPWPRSYQQGFLPAASRWPSWRRGRRRARLAPVPGRPRPPPGRTPRGGGQPGAAFPVSHEAARPLHPPRNPGLRPAGARRFPLHSHDAGSAPLERTAGAGNRYLEPDGPPLLERAARKTGLGHPLERPDRPADGDEPAGGRQRSHRPARGGRGARALAPPAAALCRPGGRADDAHHGLGRARGGARARRALQAELAPGQASYELEPRVFDERFPQRILYVQDTEQGGSRWRGVFLADVSEPMNPTLTVAESAFVLPDPAGRSLLLQLSNGSTHIYLGRETERYSVSTFAESILAMPLPTSTANLEVRRNAELGLRELWAASQQGPGWRTLRADFHRRLALPASCLLFGLVALPMGMLAQRS